MEEIHFFCSICGESLCARSKSAGGLCDCPRCLRVIPIPGFPARPGQSAESAAVYSPRILGIELKFLCEICQSKIRVDARLRGRMHECPVCHGSTSVPSWGGALPPAGAEFATVPGPQVRLTQEECEFLHAPIACVMVPATVAAE